MALIRRPTCATCSRESPLTRSIVSTSCCPGIGVRAADDAHAPKRGALRRKPSLDQTSALINLPINEQTSHARDPNSRRGSPDAYNICQFPACTVDGSPLHLMRCRDQVAYQDITLAPGNCSGSGEA